MGSDKIDKSKFTEYIITKNPITLRAFKEWVFYPGMLFNSKEKWWDNGQRDKPHEGLDLCFYRDRKDSICRLEGKMSIPVAREGFIVGIIDDFLGNSIIIEQNITSSGGAKFFMIYGHVIPLDGIDVNRVVKEGEIIAELSDAKKSKSSIFPHLHITTGRTSKIFPYDKIDWNTISDPEIFTLTDPIGFLGSEYCVLDQKK